MLTVIARYQVQTGMGDLVAMTLAKHVTATRTEPGCVQFVALRSGTTATSSCSTSGTSTMKRSRRTARHPTSAPMSKARLSHCSPSGRLTATTR